MSVESLTLALHHSRAKGNARLVLIGIANHDGDGGAWPSVATLAKYLGGADRATVQRALTRLIALGEIKRHTQQGGTRSTPDEYRPNLYEITLQCPSTCDGTRSHGTRSTLPGAPSRLAFTPVEPDVVIPDLVTEVIHRGRSSAAPPAAVARPEPSLEPNQHLRDISRPKRARARGALDLAPCGHEYTPDTDRRYCVLGHTQQETR